MKNHLSRAAGLALAASVAAVPAWAEEGTFQARFGFLAVGSVTPLEEGHVFWSGHFSGSLSDLSGQGPVHNAFVQCPGTNDLDLNAGTAALEGYCVVSDGGESRIFIRWNCTGRPGTCDEGRAEWTSGTGRWAGLTATATFTAQLGPALSDGSVPGYAVWDVAYAAPD